MQRLEPKRTVDPSFVAGPPPAAEAATLRARMRYGEHDAQLEELPVDAAAVEAKVELIQALIPLGLLHVAESLKQEVEMLAGPRYAWAGGRAGLVRYGKQDGSVYLADQKLAIKVPRVRDLRETSRFRRRRTRGCKRRGERTRG